MDFNSEAYILSVHKKCWFVFSYSTPAIFCRFLLFHFSSAVYFSQCYHQDSSFYQLFFFFDSLTTFFFPSFLLYLVTFSLPIISTSQNIIPSFHIATAPLIPGHVWRMSAFHFLIFKQYSNVILFNFPSELISHELSSSHKHLLPNSFN